MSLAQQYISPHDHLTTDPIRRHEHALVASQMRGQAWHIETYGETNSLLRRLQKGENIIITCWTVHQVICQQPIYLVAAWSHGELHHYELVQLVGAGRFTCTCRSRVPGRCRHVLKLCLWALRRYVPLRMHPRVLDETLTRRPPERAGALRTTAADAAVSLLMEAPGQAHSAEVPMSA